MGCCCGLPPYFLLRFVSDASATGCGAFIHGSTAMFHRNWSSLESQNSSTWIELATVQFALEAFVEQLCTGRVCWNTDSRNVATIFQAGSMIQELADLALGIF